MRTKVKKPSMRDIAAAVGTSAVTVSKAIAGKAGMSEELRERILKTAGEMGYTYPAGAHTPENRQLDIGILIPERYFGAESFYALMYKDLVKKLQEKGHFGLLEILTPENETKLALPNLLVSGKAQGMILLGEPRKDYYRMIGRTGIPTVFLDFYDELGTADAVTGDNAYGAYRLTSHLIRNGHTRIGFVGNRLATGSIMDRYLGYYRAMLVHRLPVREDWIVTDRTEEGTLLPLVLPEELPTAFVCNCDLVARQLVEALAERKLRVPEDISVMGFDDFEGGTQVREPELSTFRMNREGMIELAVKAILERCAGQKQPCGRTVVGGQPVYRASDRVRASAADA